MSSYIYIEIWNWCWELLWLLRCYQPRRQSKTEIPNGIQDIIYIRWLPNNVEYCTKYKYLLRNHKQWKEEETNITNIYIPFFIKSKEWFITEPQFCKYTCIEINCFKTDFLVPKSKLRYCSNMSVFQNATNPNVTNLAKYKVKQLPYICFRPPPRGGYYKLLEAA